MGSFSQAVFISHVENAKAAIGGAIEVRMASYSEGPHARWHHLPYGEWEPNSMRDAGDTVHPVNYGL